MLTRRPSIHPMEGLQVPGSYLQSRSSSSNLRSNMHFQTQSLKNMPDSTPRDDLTQDELAKTRLNRMTKRQRDQEKILEQTELSERDRLISFVNRNFHRKECRFFSEKADRKCHCGETEEGHIRELLRRSGKEKWTEECMEQIDGPTNSFGVIKLLNEGFDNRDPINFIRLSDEDNMDKILELMQDYWHMCEPQKPSLCISVIGGAKNFKLEGRKKEVFHHGLIKAAQTTNAWIITSGLNLGITRVVGNALEEARSSHWEKASSGSKLRCIGVAPWGYVLNRDSLINEPDKFEVQYKISNVIQKGQPVSLNANHTHYILVDDGKRNRYGGSKSAVVKANLQRMIKSNLGIPVVLLIVEGGLDIFEDASKMIDAGIPVVTCNSTGRAADIIAYAFKKKMKSVNKQLSIAQVAEIKTKMVECFQDLFVSPKDKTVKQAELDKNFDLLADIIKDEKLLTVFDMNRSDDLDLAILSALLKVMNASSYDDYSMQLRLALTWNRVDVASEKIFTEELQWDTEKLDLFTMQAFLEDKTDFVRLFLQNGLIMREFLTLGKLKELYRESVNYHKYDTHSVFIRMLHAKTKANANSFTLSDIRLLLRKILNKFHYHILDEDCPPGKKVAKKSDGVDDPVQALKLNFQKPFIHLFFWAVLFARQSMAKFIWERTDEAVPLALAAAKIYEEMSEGVPSYDTETRDMYLAHKDEFENLALRVIDECQNQDPLKAALLIEKKNESSGDLSCLELAASANCKRFLSCVSCQNSITGRWLNGLRHGTTLWRIIICILLPFLLPFELIIKMNPSYMDGEDTRCARIISKCTLFYTAPVTKFCSNMITYIIFLVLYSWFILFELKFGNISILEMFIMAWIGVLVVEEIREMFVSKSDTIGEKVRDWWNFSVWNRIDCIVITLSIASVIMRFVDTRELFMAARVTYILAGIFFFLRLFRLYYASSYLGPKLVMINKMVKELLIYLSILIVALLTYGVASQALLYPERGFYTNIFRDIVYYPYWQIYGEIYLDEAEALPEMRSNCNGTSGVIDSSGQVCPTKHWLVPLLLAIYLIVVNVLLLNLLIAIFSNIFQEVQENSIEIWKFNMYFLVHEYREKPVLSVPFVIVEDIVRFIIFLVRKCSECKTEEDEKTAEERAAVNYYRYNDGDLKQFSGFCLRTILLIQDYESKNTVENQLRNINIELDELYKIYDRIDEKFEEDRHKDHEHNRLRPGEECDEGAKPKSERFPSISDNQDSSKSKSKVDKVLQLPSLEDKEESTRMKKKKKRRKARDEERADYYNNLNIPEPDDRLAMLEERMVRMEQIHTQALNNIEILLRAIIRDRK